MKNRSTLNLVRILLTLMLFVTAYCIEHFLNLAWYYNLILFLVPYFLIAYDVIWKAARNIAHGQIFDENFLMLIATIGAFVIKAYPESVAVMLFYQVGEWFQRLAVGRSRRSIAHLVELTPKTACVLRDGEEKTVSPSDVSVGETIIVRAGERIPLDSVVISGDSMLDTSALTGESLPIQTSVGMEVYSGVINLSAVLKLSTTKLYENSAVSKILELVENASEKKAKSENFITLFARWYTPIIVVLSVLLIVVPGALTSDWTTWTYRALSFLMVSCPCALVISVPMTFFSGIGCFSKNGILIKGGNYIEMLSRVKTVVFDKTGTLTKGSFSVMDIIPSENRNKVLQLAATAEFGSTHPIARSVSAAYEGEIEQNFQVKEIAGKGLIATRNQERIIVGNVKIMKDFYIDVPEVSSAHTVVYVAKDEEFVGAIVIGDAVKENARAVIGELRSKNIMTVMLTGDRRSVATAVAAEIGIECTESELLPADKVSGIEKYLNDKGAVAFVGDGVNDAPVLTRADVGIAMGGIGSDAAIEAADVVIMGDDLSSIPFARRIASKTMRIVKENIVFALAVKAAVLVLSALGIANMWIAVLADVGVSILAIINAMRAMRAPKKKQANASSL